MGVVFSHGGLTFSLTAGGTATAVAETATIAAIPGTKYTLYAPGGASAPATAVLLNGQPAFTVDRKVVGITSKAGLDRRELTGPDASAEADLRRLEMVVIGTLTLPTVSAPGL